MSGHLRAYHERATEDGTHIFIASTTGVKRDGLTLDLAGGQIDNYQRNPVFLWAHDYQGRTLPIGKTSRLQLSKTRLRAHVLFDRADPFAAEVERKYDGGFLNAVSIGWVERERGPKGEISKWELLDISAVPVPGDPDALMEREVTLLRSIVGGVVSGDGTGEPLPPIVSNSTGPTALVTNQVWIPPSLGFVTTSDNTRMGDDEEPPPPLEAEQARPIGPYADWDACVTAMVDKGYTEEEAARICGAIEEQAAEARASDATGTAAETAGTPSREELAAEVDAKVDALADAIAAFKASRPVESEPPPDPALQALAEVAEALKEQNL